MTKVSRLPLRNDVWERIFKLFVETLADLKDHKKLANFIDDFFSPTEKIMFAKRLALAVLVAKGHNYTSIRKILKISPPTIAKISLKLRYGGEGLNPVIQDIFNKQSAKIFWKEIEDLLDLPVKGNIKSPERFRGKFKRKMEINKLKREF